MSRFAFALLGQTADEILQGLPCKIKDEQTGEFVASTNADDGYGFTIQNNNDSSYIVDGLPMSIYTIYAGSDQVPQSELKYKVFLNEEALAHFIDATDGGDKIWHHKLNDTQVSAALLWSSEHIASLLEEKADVEALGNVSEALASKSDTNHTHDAYAVKEAGTHMIAEDDQKLGVNAHTDDFSTRAGKMAIKQDFNNPTILDESKTLNQNLERLQNGIDDLPQAPSGYLNLERQSTHYPLTVDNIGKLYAQGDYAAAEPRTFGVYYIMAHPDDSNTAVRITLGTKTGADGST